MLKNILILWAIFMLAAAGFASYNFGRYQMAKEKDEIISQLRTELGEKNTSVTKKDGIITALRDRINKMVESNLSLSNEFNNLQTKVLGLTTIKQQAYPFQVPTNGFLGHYAGGFGGNMMGMRHLGVDIWTTMEKNGKVPGGIGNPVYSACSGIVENIDPANAAVLIKCDKISEEYDVPDHEVYTYYGHMGDAATKNLFIDIEKGTRVKKGQYLGFQGNLSSYFPEMENVHLHFSVFAGVSEADPKKGALNPCLYIEGNCSKQGSEFKILETPTQQ